MCLFSAGDGTGESDGPSKSMVWVSRELEALDAASRFPSLCSTIPLRISILFIKAGKSKLFVSSANLTPSRYFCPRPSIDATEGSMTQLA